MPRWIRSVALCAALVSAPAIASAQAMAPTVTRPLILPYGQVTGLFGLAYASSSIGSFGSGGNEGTGLHVSLGFGLGRHFELEAAVGLRLPGDLAPDRYARIDREDVFQVGNRVIGNPFARLRYGLFDRDDIPLHVGLELLAVAPLAAQTSFSAGVGVPLHVVVRPARMRIETGGFVQFVFSGTARDRNFLNVPLRVLFSLSDAWTVGVVTGVQLANITDTTLRGPYVSAGALGIFRATPTLDVMAQVLFPTASPDGSSAFGMSLSLLSRLR